MNDLYLYLINFILTMIKHKIYFTGNIHGEFMPLVFVLTKRYNLSDCSVIVYGVIGMGFYKLNYYNYR